VPNGNRDTTTVAPQALFLMNSDLVALASKSLATHLLAERSQDDAGLIQNLYRKAYGRDAAGREIDRAHAILRDAERLLQTKEANTGKRRLQSWTCLCQIVLAANEFIYVK
jgi:Protein of unknown function (DUF1553)